MYTYSASTDIVHPDMDQISHTLWNGTIRYETEIIQNEKELLFLARRKYDYRRLACDGNINIHCPSDDDDKSCTTEYSLIPFYLTDFIADGHNGVDCYSVDIGTIRYSKWIVM